MLIDVHIAPQLIQTMKTVQMPWTPVLLQNPYAGFYSPSLKVCMSPSILLFNPLLDIS